MRNWRKLFEPLTRSRRGYAADGRTLGLGLATALENSRQDATAEVKEFIGGPVAAERQRLAS